MDQPVRPHTIKLHIATVQLTGQQEGRRNSATIPQEHQGYTSRIRPCMHNWICTMEDYTPKQAITHHGNISPTIREWCNQCKIYRWNNRTSSTQDNKVQQHGNTGRPKYPCWWPNQHWLIHIQWHHACFQLQTTYDITNLQMQPHPNIQWNELRAQHPQLCSAWIHLLSCPSNYWHHTQHSTMGTHWKNN